ncbi:class I SAM-dependent methyltransferase [Paenibacillus sp. KQZ6P-2]|uniref:Class I SAM-dependent methyltransferase n=1 Tax=Paenibacillus mangrovi TaxID=2931978 RepID=A0A9X2B549_9BACL|nr:class I SAM-dependent methyltransferase [Paenibacillus mangrovi]MCJ8015211.1 class I SAM-dependent methyltransferase [Paenibacillus mangrovi]
MLECFQDYFVNPTNKSDLKYSGTRQGGLWESGLLISSDTEFKVINGVPYFESDDQGDQFTLEDIDLWTKGGHFLRRWESKEKKVETPNEVYHSLCQKAADLNLPIMDIACGPNLGLIPDLIAKNPDLKFLATDACSSLVYNWERFLTSQDATANISLASFDATRMPIRSNSVDVITSHLGFSSIRYAGDEGMKGINEAYRVLRHGGYIFAIENMWTDRDAVLEVFRQWGREPWLIFREDNLSWREKFEKAGFTIIEEKPQLIRLLTPRDNSLGEAAFKFGIKIGLEYKAYMLQKD